MHVRVRERPYVFVSLYRLVSLPRELATANLSPPPRRLVSLRVLDSPPFPPFFTESTATILPLPLSLSFGSSIGECTESHRYTCTQATRRHTYTCWTNLPLGHPFDKHNHERREARTHAHGCSHGVAVPLANYFCLVSLKTITSLRV